MLLLHGADPSQRDSQGGIWGVGYGTVRISKSLDLVKSKMYQNDGWLVSSVSVKYL